MSLFVMRLNHAVNVIGPPLQLMFDQLASGFERRLYNDWDAPVYRDPACIGWQSDGDRLDNECWKRGRGALRTPAGDGNI